jgi:hypothetical protein
MRLPVIRGLIRRRLLVNFRVDPDVMRRMLPAPFEPKLHAGFAIAGICLIRLERIRFGLLPAALGLSSENAAHRIAVAWNDDDGAPREGVYIPRRDTNSRLNWLAGGRVFPGEHHLARFDVRDDGRSVSLQVRSRDGQMALSVAGRQSDAIPQGSVFGSLNESSRFFEQGSLGYSATSDCCRVDGIELRTGDWEVKPFAVDEVRSTFFDDASQFPAGSVAFDHALVMRDVPHEWHERKSIAVGARDMELTSHR